MTGLGPSKGTGSQVCRCLFLGTGGNDRFPGFGYPYPNPWHPSATQVPQLANNTWSLPGITQPILFELCKWHSNDCLPWVISVKCSNQLRVHRLDFRRTNGHRQSPCRVGGNRLWEQSHLIVLGRRSARPSLQTEIRWRTEHLSIGITRMVKPAISSDRRTSSRHDRVVSHSV